MLKVKLKCCIQIYFYIHHNECMYCVIAVQNDSSFPQVTENLSKKTVLDLASNQSSSTFKALTAFTCIKCFS